MPGAFARTPLTSCGLTRSAIDAGMIEGTDRTKVRRLFLSPTAMCAARARS